MKRAAIMTRPLRTRALAGGALCALAAAPIVVRHDPAAPPTAATATASVRDAPPDAASIELARRARLLETRALRSADADTTGDSVTSAPLAPFGRIRDVAAADSARRLYDTLARRVPAVADWMTLRAAALDSSASSRRARSSSLRLTVSRARSARTEFAARSRWGDTTGLRAFLRTDEPVVALQWRLVTEGDRARDSVRAALTSLAGGATRHAPRAAVLLDSAFAPLTVDESRTVARAMEIAVPSRALIAWRRVVAASNTTDDDLRAWATLAARRAPAIEGARAWQDVAQRAVSPALRVWARVQQGRRLVRAGDDAAATNVLTDVVRNSPTDTSAAYAAWLLGDRAAGADRIDDARARFAWIAERHPSSPWAPRGAFEGALLVVLDRPAVAGPELDALAARWPSSEEAPGALYWAGRARAALGDSAGAIARWTRVVEGHPRSYHAMLAADRLARPLPVIPEGTPSASTPSVRQAVERMSILEALGFMPEAALERNAIESDAGDDPARLLAAAAALVTSPRPGVGIRLAQQAVDRGVALDAGVLRLLYPWPHASLIRAEAARRGVDPYLAAALIRQESRFTPDARSAVGARGLMQLMPDVARSIARAEGRRFTVAMLDDPAVNVPIGMRHLASDLARFPHPAFALASYNAGGSRVARWRTRPGADDPELFTERIPFAETREYVRTVLRTRALYRQLHGDGGAASNEQ